MDPAWLARRRVRVRCQACGEGVNYQREVRVGGRTLCRGCAGDRYYAVAMTGVIPARPALGHDGPVADPRTI